MERGWVGVGVKEGREEREKEWDDLLQKKSEEIGVEGGKGIWALQLKRS